MPRQPRQLPFLIRFVWFCLVGWWLGGAWLALTIILTPLVGIIAAPELGKMYRAAGTLLTLKQYPTDH